MQLMVASHWNGLTYQLTQSKLCVQECFSISQGENPNDKITNPNVNEINS
jgi:hypothetical protein